MGDHGYGYEIDLGISQTCEGYGTLVLAYGDYIVGCLDDTLDIPLWTPPGSILLESGLLYHTYYSSRIILPK